MFGFTLTFGILFGNNAAHEKQGDGIKAKADKLRESLQQREKKREILADLASLNVLEAATAANSEMAKRLDRESLAVLTNVTRHLEMPASSSSTPLKASSQPTASPSKISGGMPAFDSTWFSTPRSSEDECRTLYPAKGLVDFHTTRPTASKAAAAVAEKTPWEKLCAKLVAAGWSQSSIEALRATQSGHPKRQVDSVYEWFDKLEQKDVADECERFETQSSTGLVSSPELRQHHPIMETDRCEKKGDMIDKREESPEFLSRWSIECEKEQDNDLSKGETSDGEEEWMSLDDVADVECPVETRAV